MITPAGLPNLHFFNYWIDMIRIIDAMANNSSKRDTFFARQFNFLCANWHSSSAKSVCYYRVGTDLRPPLHSLNYKHFRKSTHISSKSDSCAKFHEPELIFNPLKRLFYWTCLKSKNTTKMLIVLTKRTKISMSLPKILWENNFFHL